MKIGFSADAFGRTIIWFACAGILFLLAWLLFPSTPASQAIVATIFSPGFLIEDFLLTLAGNMAAQLILILSVSALTWGLLSGIVVGTFRKLSASSSGKPNQTVQRIPP